MYCPMFRQPTAYQRVIAYTATQPILVNGVNINAGTYPVLNYQPPQAQYPYIYVPIAEFSRVGARVTWDEAKQLLSVTTDYYENKRTIAQQQAQITQLQNKINQLQTPPPAPTPIPPGFVLTVTGIDGLTPAQVTEVNNLAATKTIDELTALSTDAYNQAVKLATAKGGQFVMGGAIVGDGDAFSASFNNITPPIPSYIVKLHSNDPNLQSNYDKYTPEQKAKYNLVRQAAAYYVLRSSVEKLQALS